MDPSPHRVGRVARRRRPRGPSTYTCSWYDRYETFYAIVVVLPLTVAVTIGLVVAGEADAMPWLAAIDVAVVGYTAYHTLYLPSQVVLDDEGVLLKSRVRRVFVPWAELLDLTHSPGSGQFPGRLRWGRARGRAVRTPAEFPDLFSLLKEIERRAPHVTIYA
jgi:hypothetical protein